MDFSDALRALRDGKRVTRHLWSSSPLGDGVWLELAHPSLPDGRPLMPQLLVQSEDGIVRPFPGANWDLLADDWEITRALRSLMLFPWGSGHPPSLPPREPGGIGTAPVTRYPLKVVPAAHRISPAFDH